MQEHTLRKLGFCLILALLWAPARGADDPIRGISFDISGAYHDSEQDGPWKSQDLLARLQRGRSTGYAFLSLAQRPQGSGSVAGVGISHRWTSRLLSYTSASFAPEEAIYLPEFRFDADVSVAWRRDRRLSTSLGVTRLQYPGDRRDDLLSASVTVHGPIFATYRFFQNYSHPGRVASNAQLIKIGHIRSGRFEGFLQYSWGNEAYVLIPSAPSQSVDLDGSTWTLHYRHWIGRQGGLFAELESRRRGPDFEQQGGRLGVFFSF